jgi:hypothetical protein
MKIEAKLMKTLSTSDINTMLQSARNSYAVRPDMPVSTAVTWGLNVVDRGHTAIWGTLPVGGALRRLDFTAIWGTCGIEAPGRYANANAGTSSPCWK